MTDVILPMFLTDLQLLLSVPIGQTSLHIMTASVFNCGFASDPALKWTQNGEDSLMKVIYSELFLIFERNDKSETTRSVSHAIVVTKWTAGRYRGRGGPLPQGVRATSLGLGWKHPIPDRLQPQSAFGLTLVVLVNPRLRAVVFAVLIL